MKITLDIPDGTLAAFFDFVYQGDYYPSMMMQGHSIGSEELYDGAEIEIKAAGVQDD